MIVSSRKIDGCQAVADAITAEGGKATAIACHIGEMEQIQNVFAQIREQFGRLDILVNNAATNPQFCNVLETDLGAFQKTVDVNIRGYYFMSIEGGKLMKEHGGGSIINVASINGVSPGEFQGIYSVTKAAVISMTKVFAKECAQFGIRCNALLPGLTDTKFASALVKNDAIRNLALQRIPLKRVAEPSEMAGAVLYLASEASSYTTGVALNVDGGFFPDGTANARRGSQGSSFHFRIANASHQRGAPHGYSPAFSGSRTSPHRRYPPLPLQLPTRQPPFTDTTVPVTDPASGEASQATAAGDVLDPAGPAQRGPRRRWRRPVADRGRRERTGRRRCNPAPRCSLRDPARTEFPRQGHAEAMQAGLGLPHSPAHQDCRYRSAQRSIRYG